MGGSVGPIYAKSTIWQRNNLYMPTWILKKLDEPIKKEACEYLWIFFDSSILFYLFKFGLSPVINDMDI
jgi:hypothetical protein